MSKSSFAVLMTIYRSDSLGLFEVALRSVETQDVDAILRIYLCVDGPLPSAHDAYLAKNIGRFYKILRNEVNIGLAKSLNRLIDSLEDETLVFRMDADDVSHGNRFRMQALYMEKHPDLSLVGCQAYDIDERGCVIKERRYATEPDDVSRLLCRLTAVLHPTFCFRRSIFHDRLVRYPDAHLCEDTALLVSLSLAGHRIANVDEILFSWRIGSSFFERRRDPKRGWGEMTWHAKAVRARYGLLSPEYCFPVMRFLLRCIPSPLARALYNGGIRERIMLIGKTSVR